MKYASILAFSFFAVSLTMFGQSDVPTFKAEAKSAFVWGEDAPGRAVSSTVQDPPSGNAIYKLTYGEIEVSSRIGFEGVGKGEAGAFLTARTTIANGTRRDLSVSYGGVSVDGHTALPLEVIVADKYLNKNKSKSRSAAVEIQRMHCFTSGFLPAENIFSSKSSRVLVAPAGKSLTVSFVIRDPRYYSLLCSMEGCHPTGTIRYYLTVNMHDYVFVWPGRSAVDCGS